MKILITALDPSADAICAHLITRWRARNPSTEFLALGGKSLHNAGANLISDDIVQYSSLGVINNLWTVPVYYSALKRTLQWVKQHQPDLIILCDSRFFNLKLATHLKKQNYHGKIAYFIAPVLWQELYDPSAIDDPQQLKRFDELKPHIDLAILAYPVSIDIYQIRQIPHEFYGHPLSDSVSPKLSRAEFLQLYQIPCDRKLVAFFPGIRKTEFNTIAPTLLKVKDRLLRDHISVAWDVAIPTSCADNEFRIAREHHFELLAYADLVISKSGTVIHEATLLAKPVICVYRVPAWQAWMLRYVIRFNPPMISLTNLIAGREVIPELIQEKFTVTNTYRVATDLLNDPARYQKISDEIALIKAKLWGDHPLEKIIVRLEDLMKS